MASNDYLKRHEGNSNDQIEKISDLVTGQGDLTQQQLQEIIARLDVLIINLIAGRKGRMDSYSLSGAGGRSISPAAALQELRTQRDYYHNLLKAVPTMKETIYDSPDT